MWEMKESERPRKPYIKPVLTHCQNIRTLTLGASTFPGESGGFEANPNPGSASTGKTNTDVFENAEFKSYDFGNDISN